jgi:hypothetical protein
MTLGQNPQQPRQAAPIIPAQRGRVTMLRFRAFQAIMTGLVLRLFFAFRYPTSTDDSNAYLQLAHNWIDHHVYGLWINGRLVPTDLRMPGYPAFLAGVAMMLGRSLGAISLSQAFIDLGTCCLTAVLAVGLAPVGARRAAWIAGLWLAATCPFIANYTAVVLTESLVAFFATAALACFILGLRQNPSEIENQRRFSPLGYAACGSFLTGLATLVRPEMPLLVGVAGIVYVLRLWSHLNLRKIVLLGAAMVGAFLLPLAPWAARNFVTLHKVEILAPRFVTLPGEYAPVGYYAWTKTWLERYRDVYLSVWKIGEEPVDVGDLPAMAFDSPREKARITALFAQYNKSEDLDISPEMDHEFAEIAAERTRRDPLRTYLRAPFQRALSIWFTPRTELLPIDGKLWPLADQWRDSAGDVLTTAGFGALGYLYVALAAGGVWIAWRSSRRAVGAASSIEDLRDGPNLWGIALLLVYLFVRTLFLTTVEAPEPRYVVSCYPVVLAMIALLFTGGSDQRSSTGSG